MRQDSGFQGAYEIIGELGRGSFGQVYRARQRSTGQDVAVKVVQFLGAALPGAADRHVQRFRRELRLCAELFHPNIVRLIDSGETSDGMLYAVFEHVPGTTLKEVLAAETRLEPREAAHLMSQVLDALSCAHARGIVHRDLTPANIMVTKTGARRNALVLDFGLGGVARDVAAQAQTRITATHELLGTPCYAAPEQLRGEPPSPGSDFYSWGLVLLECLTGELPVSGASAQEVIYKQLGPDPVPIPRWLRSQPLGQVIEEVTAKRLEKRRTDVASVLDALGGIATAERIGAAAPAQPAAATERGRRQLTVTCYRLSVAATGERELDVEEVDQLIEAQHVALTKHAARAGGKVVAVLADRVFMVHGYPQAHEGDARRAARAALDIVLADPRRNGDAAAGGHLRCEVHVGIHTGLVLVRDPGRSNPLRPLELTGLTPQISSRLADLAAEGEVLVSADTNLVLRTDFDSELAGECALSELSRPMPAYRIVSGQRRASELERSAAGLPTPLVGRSHELERLLEGWKAAGDGRPSVHLITGEAGIGKSRLLRELRQRVGVASWIEWECTPESQTAPLRPVVDALAAVNEPLGALLARLDMDVQRYLPWLAALVSSAGEAPDPTAPQLSPDRQKELTLEALLTLVFTLSQRQPFVLAVENIHWADPTTLELLMLLAQELRASRVGDPTEAPRLCVVLTTRPEFIPAWAGENLSFLPLQRLAKGEVEEMVRASLRGAGAPPAELVDVVFERAEGIPLFVEEITRLVSDTQRRRASRSGSGTHHPAAEVPTSLRDLLTARLDCVSQPARETAQLAAVLGREFGYELLQAVSPRDDGLLREDIAELAQSGLVFPRRTGGGQRYLFRHALLRDAAYEALTRPTREALHRRVAQVLREQFPDLVQRRPETLALHHQEGGEATTAVDCWLLAGQQSYRAAAYAEAVSQLERGLSLARTLEESVDNRRREVDLLVAYGTSLLSTRGWADNEVETTFSRALEVAESLGGDPPLMVLYGLWGVLILRSNRPALETFLPRLEALVAGSTDRVVDHFCHSILGIAATWRGDFPASGRFLERALAAYDEEQFYASYDSGVYTYALYFNALWALGYAERAVALREESFALAKRRRDPYSLAVVLAFAGVLANNCRDGEAEVRYGEQLMALSTEQRLFAFWPAGACGYGAGLVKKGKIDEGLRFIRDGLERYRAFGIMGSYSDHQAYLADAYLAAGRLDEAMAAVEESLGLCETLYARWHEPELWRLHGEILLRRGDATSAETSLRRSLAIADERQAPAYTLRSANALARLLRDTGREREVPEILAPLYDRFTEGFETLDLREARSLLDGLRAA